MKYIIRFLTLHFLIRLNHNCPKWIKIDQTWSNWISGEIIIAIYHQNLIFLIFLSDWIRSVQNESKMDQTWSNWDFWWNLIKKFWYKRLSIVAIFINFLSFSFLVLITFDNFCLFYVFNHVSIFLYFIISLIFSIFSINYTFLSFKSSLVFNNQATRA